MALSDTYPEVFAKSRGKTLIRYNIHEVQVTDELGIGTRIAFEYDEASVEGKVTKAKILAAMYVAEKESDKGNIEEAVTQYENARTKLKTMKVKVMSVPELSKAVALILDMLGIEYDRT